MTSKAKEYARLVLSGLSRAEAYKKAYNKPDLSNEQASKNAWKLEKKGEILEKREKLEVELDRRAVAGKQRRMEVLSSMMEGCYKEGDVRGAVACIGELNKMDGAYAPERVEAAVEARSFAAVMAAVTDVEG